MAGKTTKSAAGKDETTTDASLDASGTSGAAAEVASRNTGDDTVGADGGSGAEGGESTSGSDADAPVDGPENTDTSKSEPQAPVEVKVPERKAVVFLGPYSRYSRGDIACFESDHADELVSRRIAVWPKDAKRAMAPKPGDNDFDTDIG